MNEDYNKKFEAMTENLALENLYDQLASRAVVARTVALHCTEVYKAARKAGLPRSLAAFMAKDYWEYEMRPQTTTTYIVDGEVEGL